MKEKDQEIFAAKQQLNLVEDRQSLEAENMKKTAQVEIENYSQIQLNL